MSLWSAEPLVLALAPDSVALLKGGKRETVTGQRDPVRLLPQLEPLLERPEWRAGRIDVVFSHKLVRHALTAPTGKPLSAAEETALARSALVEIYGEEAAAWRVRSVSQPPDYGVLGAGVDEALCAGLEALGKRHGSSVHLRPLAAALREPRGAAGCDAWFVVEPGWATLFYGRRGEWRHVAARAVGDDWRDELPRWLARAVDQHGKSRSARALVQTVGMDAGRAPALDGWNWQMTQAAAGQTGALALAMGCA